MMREPSAQYEASGVGEAVCRSWAQPEDIDGFLEDRPHLSKALDELEEALPDFFPSHRLRLDLLLEPEGPPPEVLYCGIQVRLPLDEAEERSEAFCARWWFREHPELAGELILCPEIA